MLTKQKIFNKVTNHLLTQKRQCKKNGECQYRGKDGLACAIGCLIPNKYYQREWDEYATSIHDILSEYSPKNVFGQFLSQDVTSDFLGGLQEIHDWHHPNSWRKLLTEFAADNYLKMPKVLL